MNAPIVLQVKGYQPSMKWMGGKDIPPRDVMEVLWCLAQLDEESLRELPSLWVNNRHVRRPKMLDK
jgi:hypothetical protein